MAGPTSPGAEGPTFGPPHLPPGWIAQWDGASKKYYYVQLSTGVSQWDTPTDAAPTGTPAPGAEHPYGVPRQQELITHPDGSQTVRHVDGSMEPVNPPMPPDGTRGVDGPTGDRGLGSMAMNALLGGKSSSGNANNNHGGSGSNPFGNLAGQFLGGGSHGGGGAGKNALGKLGGALASSFLHSGDKPDQPQSFHSGQTTGHQQQQQQQGQHGLAGSLMGGVANMFGGNKPPHGQNSNYGYSNSGASGGAYSGQAPPTSYQPPGAGSTTPGASAYHSSPPGHGQTQSFPPPPGQNGNQNSGQQTHPTYGQIPGPPPGKPPGGYGQASGYGAPSQGSHQQHYSGSGGGNGSGYEPTYGSAASTAPGAYPGSSQPSYSQGPGQQGHGYGSQY